MTIFTKDFGIIRAVCYGAKSIRNKNSASTQVMTYADFVLVNTNKELMSVQNAEIIESFFGVKEDIAKLSLCVYFADVVYSLLNTNSSDEGMLSLILNSVYALSHKENNTEKVRTVFELRAMALGGYMPDIYSCVKCNSAENIAHFSPTGGGIVCEGCKNKSDILIDADVYYALSYILTADVKKMLSFNVPRDVLKKLTDISENYVKAFSDKPFKSLEYYKQMLTIN